MKGVGRAVQQKRKKQKPYLLGGNFFALTSPLGSTSNNQEQRISQNLKIPISLVFCFLQVRLPWQGEPAAPAPVKSGSASASSPQSQAVSPGCEPISSLTYISVQVRCGSKWTPSGTPRSQVQHSNQQMNRLPYSLSLCAHTFFSPGSSL